MVITVKVRRLTVLECERLQGLPDNWTNVEFKGKPASDAKRYKAIGNGMAQPCADFVMQRVVEAIRNSKENNHVRRDAYSLHAVKIGDKVQSSHMPDLSQVIEREENT